MTRPCERSRREVKDNGLLGRTIKEHSYVVTLCRIGGNRVSAVRMEYYGSKTDVHNAIAKQFPGWKIKTISRLYDEDFQDE